MGNYTLFIQLGLMFVVIYFFMIRPQQQRAKNEKSFESGLKVGDKIITKSGIHGKISELAETTVVVETMSGKLKMERSAISLEMSAALNKKAQFYLKIKKNLKFLNLEFEIFYFYYNSVICIYHLNQFES